MKKKIYACIAIVAIASGMMINLNVDNGYENYLFGVNLNNLEALTDEGNPNECREKSLVLDWGAFYACLESGTGKICPCGDHWQK